MSGTGTTLRVAVVSLTRDRLAYTQKCFQTLRDNAGCEFDWFCLDQGSEDGTGEWLLTQDDINVTLLHENIGISRALNLLLDEALNPADYDAVVKVDNDCELLTPGTLKECAEVAVTWHGLVSPKIHGLRQPPLVIGAVSDERWTVELTPVIGGVFLAAPASIYADGYRYDEHNPAWGGDDTGICGWHRSQGGMCGYLTGYDANHYLTTEGQVADQPAYFERRVLEGGPAK